VQKELKQQITVVFCGNLLGQVVYKGKTKRCHPQYKFPSDWHITRHCSTEETMVEKIILPFVEHRRDMLGEEKVA